MAEKLKQRATVHAKLIDEFEKHNRNLNRFGMIENFQKSEKETHQLNICFVNFLAGLGIRIHHEFWKLSVIYGNKRPASIKY